MKYAFAAHGYEEADATRKEQARISAWHATFNAVLPALLRMIDNDEAIEQARKIANKIHGALE